jgi:hypothetical protein
MTDGNRYPPDSCASDPEGLDYAPFDDVTIRRLRDRSGEPTDWVTIEGRRNGGARGVQIRYEQLWGQIGVHLEARHGNRMDDAMSMQEFMHATIRAAIVFLMD